MHIVVTGASSGIGREVAKAFDRTTSGIVPVLVFVLISMSCGVSNKTIERLVAGGLIPMRQIVPRAP